MKSLPWRSVLYALVLGYLVLDLKTCQGPLSRKIAETRPSSDITREKALKLGWVAMVNREPVTGDQLDLAVARFCHQRALDREKLGASRVREIRRAALNGLIDNILIRQYADGEGFSATEEETEAFVAAWEKQFPDGEMLERQTELQDLTPEERTEELERIWSRKVWLEKRIAPGVGVGDDEVREWFDLLSESGDIVEPEKVKARQIFIATLEADEADAESRIREAHRRISEGEPFADVAREVSEDARTREWGGELNWMSRRRLLPGLAEPIFAQPVGQIGEPFKSKIGWHLVEVLEKQPERPARFEEVEDELRATILTQQKRDTVRQLLDKLRKVANIVLFPENIDSLDG